MYYSTSSAVHVSFGGYDLLPAPSPMYLYYCLFPCRRLSRLLSTMSWSEFPVPSSTPTLRLAVPTCFAGGKGHSQVLVQFSSSMPHSLTPVESTRAHHIALFMLASVTLTASPSAFSIFNGAESSQEVRSSLRPTGFAALRPESYQTGRKTRYWWVVSPCQIETFILSEPPSFAWRTNVFKFPKFINLSQTWLRFINLGGATAEPKTLC